MIHSSGANDQKQQRQIVEGFTTHSPYHAGLLEFEKLLASCLQKHRLKPEEFHSLMLLGRDLYRISYQSKPKQAMEAMARVGALRVKRRFKPKVVIEVLLHGWNRLVSPRRPSSFQQLKSLTLDYARLT